MATRTIAGCLHKAGDKGGNRVQQSGGEDGGVIATVAPVRYMMEAVLPSLSFVSIRQISCREPRAAVASEVRAHGGVLGSREGRALGDDEEGRVDRGAKKRHLVVQKPCLLPPAGLPSCAGAGCVAVAPLPADPCAPSLSRPRNERNPRPDLASTRPLPGCKAESCLAANAEDLQWLIRDGWAISACRIAPRNGPLLLQGKASVALIANFVCKTNPGKRRQSCSRGRWHACDDGSEREQVVRRGTAPRGRGLGGKQDEAKDLRQIGTWKWSGNDSMPAVCLGHWC